MNRPMDAPKQNNALLLKRLQQMLGEDFHPVLRMAENAYKLDKIARETNDPTDIKNAVDGWDKVAQYTVPKPKVIEHQIELVPVPDEDQNWTVHVKY